MQLTGHSHLYSNDHLLQKQIFCWQVEVMPQPSFSILVQCLFRTSNHKTQYLTSNFWVIHKVSSLHSTNYTKTTVFKQQTSSHIICSQQLCFAAVEQQRPLFYGAQSTFDAKPDVMQPPKMLQISKWQLYLLQALFLLHSHELRYN